MRNAAKVKFYGSIIRPIATYECQAWTLKAKSRRALQGFENNVLRVMVGPEIKGWGLKTKVQFIHQLHQGEARPIYLAVVARGQTIKQPRK